MSKSAVGIFDGFYTEFVQFLVMSGKEELRDQFDIYLDELLDYASQELVEGHTLTKPVRKKKMSDIDQSMREQRDIALDYTESVSNVGNDYDIERLKRSFLKSNPFIKDFSGPKNKKKQLYSDLFEHLDKVANDLSLLLESDAESFEGMITSAYPDREEAENILEKNFEYTNTIKSYGDHISLSMVPERVISFSDDIVPVIEEAERRLEARISQDLDRIYD